MGRPSSPKGDPGATNRSPSERNFKVFGRFLSVINPPLSYGDKLEVSPILKELAGSPFKDVKGNGAQSFSEVPPIACPLHPVTSENAYKESTGGEVAGTPSGTA
jgi:hypothetical protein